MKKEEVETICPASRMEWREWLQNNHDKKQAVWMIYYKKKSDNPSLTWSEAVDEALCFGWIDSKRKTVDKERFIQFFSRRKAKSTWSKINKEKIQRLTDEGLMTSAGLKAIETAMQNGSWSTLDEVEELIIPEDLEKEFNKYTDSKSYFLSLSRSDRRNILGWIVLAKREETRKLRIRKIAEFAAQKMKPDQFR